MNGTHSRIHAACDPELTTSIPTAPASNRSRSSAATGPTVLSGGCSSPAACRIDARRAREFAFELLMLAEVAEQWEQAR